MMIRLTASRPPQLPDSLAGDIVRVKPTIGNAIVAAGCGVVVDYEPCPTTGEPATACRVARPAGWTDEEVDRAMGRESKERDE